jgi:SAM-dependent methyltransferase
LGVSHTLFQRCYPDQRRSGTLFFYGHLRGLAVQGRQVLNLGAGPGDRPETPEFAIRDLRGPGHRVFGCDPDPDVLGNRQVDEARTIGPDGAIPYEDGAFDIVYSDYVLEHVEQPEKFLAEVFRVLKPGGAFHFRTPNLYHYVSIAARILPHSIASRTANRVRSLDEGAHDPYPTFHRLNTRRALRKFARKVGFSDVDFTMFEGEPSYLMFNSGAFLVGVAYERIVNGAPCLAGLRANIMGRMVK